jgi:hypothetical protein
MITAGAEDLQRGKRLALRQRRFRPGLEKPQQGQGGRQGQDGEEFLVFMAFSISRK